MQRFKRLTVWKKAHELALRTHAAPTMGTGAPHPDLVARLRQSSVSIVTSIAGGSRNDAPLVFARRIDAAINAAREFDSLLLLAHELHAIDHGDFARLSARSDEVGRMLVGLRKRERLRATDRRTEPAERTRPSSS